MKAEYDSSRPVRLIAGNSYYHLKDWTSAIKHYRILVDSIDDSSSWLRSRIFSNIGACHVHDGDYLSALACYQNRSPNDASINGLLCALALNDGKEACREFERWLSSHGQINSRLLKTGVSLMINAGIASHDRLRECLGSSDSRIVDTIDTQKDLDEFQFNPTITQTNKIYERVESLGEFKANLLFIKSVTDPCLQPTEIDKVDRFNENELVNTAFFVTDRTKKLEMYDEASRLNVDCWEARYNTGLILMTDPETLELSLKILSSITCAHAVLKRAEIYETLCRNKMREAVALYTELVASNRYRNDARILERIGYIHDEYLGNRVRAVGYYEDSFHVDPSRKSVLIWLSQYSIETEDFESAITYFELLIEIEPTVSKWYTELINCYKEKGDMKSANKISDEFKIF